MPQTRTQIWGTLKRYLAYTAAGFVVLGGVGAMEAARPPLVGTANASQTLRASVSPQALLATIASDAPSWTQRLRFDLAAANPIAVAEAAVPPAPMPTPYYPAPDTAWMKDASTETPVEAPVVAVAEPVKPAPVATIVAAALAEADILAPIAEAEPAVAAPSPLFQTVAAVLPTETLLAMNDAPAKPSAQPSKPLLAPPVADAPEPAAPAPVASTPAPNKPVAAAKPKAATNALLATLNWVYDGVDTPVTNDMPAPTAAAASDAAAADAVPTDMPLSAMTPSQVADATPLDDALSDVGADMPTPNAPAEQAAAAAQTTTVVGLQKVIEVRRGDTLFGLLIHAGVPDSEAQAAGHSLADVFSPSDLKVGQEITLNFATGAGPDQTDADGNKLLALTLTPSVERDVKLTRASDGQFVAATVDRPLTERVDRAAGDIDVSLFESARDAGLPVGLIGELIKAFSYDVDFQRDIHEGDSFETLYERYDTAAGDLAKAGRLLYAALNVGGKPVAIYYFERDGEGEYFTADGVAVRKSLLKTPIDGAKITSGYGMRVNPILGYSAMHQGIDFGAPLGTPIFAAGTGTIEEMDWKNGYGNYVKVRHNGTYETAYAHISKFASGLHRGSKVKQGQVIAYVGATGRATGPHLHFEILINGAHVNPSTVKTVASDKLSGPALKAFKAQVALIAQQRRELAARAEIADQSGNTQLDCTHQRGCAN